MRPRTRTKSSSTLIVELEPDRQNELSSSWRCGSRSLAHTCDRFYIDVTTSLRSGGGKQAGMSSSSGGAAT